MKIADETLPEISPLFTEFTPSCLDCGYELKGLPDGKCPECGLRFEHEALKLHHAVLLEQRRESRARWKRQGWHVFFGAAALSMFICTVNGILPIFSPITFVIAFVVWAGALIYWTKYVEPGWFVQAHRILGFVLPLAIMLLIVSGTPHRTWSVPVTLAAMVGVCFVAVRGSPLVSSLVLLVAAIVPMMIAGMLIRHHAASILAKGFGWTELDKPTTNGWKPLLASEALQIGLAMEVASIAIACIVAFFVRRAMVRLRRLSNEGRHAGNFWQQRV